MRTTPVFPSPSQADLAPVPEAPRRSGRLLEEIAALLQSCPPPAEFHAAFLQRVLAALHGTAGALWDRPTPDSFHLQYQSNLNEIGLERITNGRSCHAELLRQAAARTEPLWVPPHSGPDVSGGRVTASNLSGYGLLLAPILIDGVCGGLIEVWVDFYQDSQAWRPAARLLNEVAAFAAAYHHKNRLRQLEDQHRLWGQLETLLRRLHGSLDPREVATVAANELRPLLGCDQVAVAVRRGDTLAVEAVSGATHVDRAGGLVRALEALCQAVSAWGETLNFGGSRDETLPPAVQATLDAYLKESNARALVAVPLKDGRDAAGQLCRSALVAESFEAAPVEALRGRVEAVAPHLAAALFNAAEHATLPLGWLSRRAGKARAWLRGRSRTKLAIAVATFMLVAAVLALVPAPLRRDAGGQLLPVERQILFAPVTGRVVELKVQSGDAVHKGQELLFLEDLETQLKVDQLAIKIAAAEHRLAVLNEQLGRPGSDDDRDALTRERIAQEYELRKATAERGLLLSLSRNAQRTPLAAPLAGKVVTFDAREQLVGKTVKPGDPLLRVARVQGAWEIELYLPEGNVGHVREGLARSADGTLEVDVLLSSRPDSVSKARLSRDGLGGEAVVKSGAVVVPARCSITDPELLRELETMPVGVELRAKVHCGRRSLGYVLFCDLLEFVYEHVWF
jgi:multidrug efflux pump subunit AcrA (membrane-fusion protein)